MTSHEGGSNRQLGSGEGECLASQRFIDTIHLIEDFARLDFSNPVLRVTLTVTHTNFGRLLGNRLVREDTDPDATTPLDVTGHGATSSFDLTSRQTTATGGLEAPFAEGNLRAASRQTFVTALMFLAELATIRLQHVKHLPFLRASPELRPQPSSPYGCAACRLRACPGYDANDDHQRPALQLPAARCDQACHPCKPRP